MSRKSNWYLSWEITTKNQQTHVTSTRSQELVLEAALLLGVVHSWPQVAAIIFFWHSWGLLPCSAPWLHSCLVITICPLDRGAGRRRCVQECSSAVSITYKWMFQNRKARAVCLPLTRLYFSARSVACIWQPQPFGPMRMTRGVWGATDRAGWQMNVITADNQSPTLTNYSMYSHQMTTALQSKT